MTADSLETALREGLAALGLALPDAAVRQLLDYMAALERWNRVYNLTAVRAPAEMLTHHLLDSLAVVAPLRRHLGLPPVPAQAPEGLSAAPVRVLDVGSGGGLPGVVLAIACPDLQVTCVDAVAKKAAFVGQVAASLRLFGGRAALHADVAGDPRPIAGPLLGIDVGDGRDLCLSGERLIGVKMHLAHEAKADDADAQHMGSP